MEEQAKSTGPRWLGPLLALFMGLGALAPPAPAAGAKTAPGQAGPWPQRTDLHAAPASCTETTRTIEVDSIADDNPTGGCTLREAIDQANFDLIVGVNGCIITESGAGMPATYLINLPAYTYTLGGAAGDDSNWSGDLDIRANVTIIGTGADSTEITALSCDRVFHIDPTSSGGLTVTFVDLAISGGLVNGDGAGIYNDGDNTVNVDHCTINANDTLPAGAAGAGIYNKRGTVNLKNSILSNNAINANVGDRARGGGIHTSHGTLSVSDSNIHHNTARAADGPGSQAQGGGIYSFDSTVSITNTLLSENNATCPAPTSDCDGRGGGIYHSGGTLLVAEGSTISDNQSKDMGGGIYSHGGTTTVASSTVSGNMAANGAGAYCLLGCKMDISANSAIYDNQAGHSGGGIYGAPGGRLTVDGSAVSGNTADQDGGGIYIERAAITIDSSTVAGNSSTENHGGGIYNAHGDVTLNDSTVAGNIGADHGGGIYSSSDFPGGTLALDGCTISSNTARSGGGIYLYYSPATLTNTTISDNWATASSGGGIGTHSDHPQTADLFHCTITANAASISGGGARFEPSYTVNVSNTIVAGNSAGDNSPDIAGAINSQDHNLIQDPSGATISGTTTHNITGQDPRLGPLAHNGGETETHALLSGSPAIDAVAKPNCTLRVDQRGVDRPQRAACDIGAYEAEMVRVYLPLVFGRY